MFCVEFVSACQDFPSWLLPCATAVSVFVKMFLQHPQRGLVQLQLSIYRPGVLKFSQTGHVMFIGVWYVCTRASNAFVSRTFMTIFA